MNDPTFLIMLAAIVAMMWWMSRRSKKQRAAAESFRDSLTVGQDVMTGSGLFGTISEITDERITLVSGPAASTSVWLRAAIAKVVEPELVPEAEELDLEVPDDASTLDPAPVEDGSAAREPGTEEPGVEEKKNPYE
ncbi:MAG: preprotein translocase subunit YajC [Cellulomonadaceae bacterium]